MDKEVLKSYLDKLNNEQRQAATLGSESAVILAAAGSGKTSTLTTRIAYLHVEKEIPLQHMLAVTFTNKAAREMRERLNKMGLRSRDLWIGTFHGICNKILQTHASQAGLKRGFTIMDTQEQETFFKRMLRSNGYDPKVVSVSYTLSQINGYKEVGWRSDRVPENLQEKKLYRLYEDACQVDNVVDFAELMLRCYEMFKNHQDLADKYAEQFEHILVDEFQDTNELQYRWLKILSGKHKNIFAVGDDDQSIYGFRGARPENMNLLKKDFNAKVVKIEKNYRSEANILQLANGLIINNTNRQGKNMIPTIATKNAILTYFALNNEEEASFIAGEMKRLRRTNIQYKDMAILYRTNSQSRALEKALNSHNIPYIVFGGFRFFDRQEVKHAMAYLRLAYEPKDNLAFLRVVNTPARAIGDSTVRKLEVLSQQHKVSLFESVALLDAKTGKKFENFINMINHLNLQTKQKNLKKMVETVIVDSGLENMYENDKKEGPERLDNLYELISAADVYMVENPSADITEFLAFSSLESDINTKKRDENADAVKLMTVHSSKGLEFEAVFIAGLEQGLFPHANALKNKEEGAIEEERRLMYVALTRAKHNLYLSCAEERRVHGITERFPRSMFWKEFDQTLLKRIK